ncbi:MAG: hypothetical protein MRY72_10190 [Aquisalinus sp.]|nr:hypothetical protein [Aquisalinus sp.]
MGREVRRVPKDWQHPVDKFGKYIPLGDEFDARAKRWDINNAAWEKGKAWNFVENKWQNIDAALSGMTYTEADGPRPHKKDFMPDWPQAQRTHYQMYSTTSEGTPISPVMSSPRKLALWLADTKASALAGQPATYKEWLPICQGKTVPTGVNMKDGNIKSGVSVLSVAKNEETLRTRFLSYLLDQNTQRQDRGREL